MIGPDLEPEAKCPRYRWAVRARDGSAQSCVLPEAIWRLWTGAGGGEPAHRKGAGTQLQPSRRGTGVPWRAGLRGQNCGQSSVLLALMELTIMGENRQ